MHDYWKNASLSDWRRHVIRSIEISRHLITDRDQTFLEVTRILNDAYLFLHKQRVSESPPSKDEHELEDLFWGLQRSSTVIDSIVGSACVALMRWMEKVKWITIGEFILLETKFPFENDQEPEEKTRKRHHCSITQGFGSRVPGKETCGALGVWQIGNIFKHGGGTNLHKGTAKVAKELGFSSGMLRISENESEEVLREMSLKEVSYTLEPDSIERMALQLGCGPDPGLMPLYDHVESWQKAIEQKLLVELGVLRALEKN